MKIVCLDICLLFDRGDSVSLTRASQFAAKQVEASRMKVKVLLHCFFSSINSDKLRCYIRAFYAARRIDRI
jgi:hypothetical protein